MAYTSIVDYLSSQGQKSDYSSRAKLASQYGISGYQGTASQNTQLLGLLQKPKTAPVSGPTSPTKPLTSGVNLNLSGGLPSTNSGTNLANNFMSSYLKNPFPGVNKTNPNSLFSVSGNTANGVTSNGAGFQVPGTTTPPSTPKITAPNTDLYSNKPNTEITSQAIDPVQVKTFFDNSSRPANTTSIPSVIPADNLSTSQGYSLPDTQAPSMDYTALLKSIQTMGQPNQNTTDLDVSIKNLMGGNANADAGLLDQQKNIMDITGQLAGRDKAQFNAEKTAGVYDFQKQLNDVNSQINQLQKENEITKLNAQGQPIPQEEINKQTADADRRYAVKALGLASIAQTIQGNLALAQDYATKSVDAEFAPLESQLEYLKLALEYNKENFTREEKKRSEQLALMIDQREQLLTEEKDNRKSVFNIMQSAVEAGADAKTLNDIINSKTPEEALIAGQAFLAAGTNGLTEAQASNAFKMAADFESASGDYSKIVTNFNKIQAAASNPSPAGDLALIFSYMKMLDPGSVVREGEFANAQNAAGVPDQIRNWYNRISSGERLNPEQRNDFVGSARSLYQTETQQQQQVINQFVQRAQAYGIPPDLVVRNMGSNYAGGTGQTGQTGQRDALDDVLDGVGFNNVLGKTVNGLKLDQLGDGAANLARLGGGTITGIDGSKYWKYGLDFVLSGGKGASVPAPFSGVVKEVRSGYSNPNGTPLATATGKSQNGGFGNQVKIQLPSGEEVWVSHLDSVAGLQPGQKINAGMPLGTQGNTGLTYGNTGVHLDITMTKPDGSKYSAREVAAILGDSRLS